MSDRRLSDSEFCLVILGILFGGSYGFAFVISMLGYGSLADSFAVWPVTFVGACFVLAILFLFVLVENWLGDIFEEAWIEPGGGLSRE